MADVEGSIGDMHKKAACKPLSKVYRPLYLSVVAYAILIKTMLTINMLKPSQPLRLRRC